MDLPRSELQPQLARAGASTGGYDAAVPIASSVPNAEEDPPSLHRQPILALPL